MLVILLYLSCEWLLVCASLPKLLSKGRIRHRGQFLLSHALHYQNTYKLCSSFMDHYDMGKKHTKDISIYHCSIYNHRDNNKLIVASKKHYFCFPSWPFIHRVHFTFIFVKGDATHLSIVTRSSKNGVLKCCFGNKCEVITTLKKFLSV